MTDADATKRPVYPTPWRLEETPMTFHVRDVNGCSVVCGVGRLAGEEIVSNANHVPALVAACELLLTIETISGDSGFCSYCNCDHSDHANDGCPVLTAHNALKLEAKP